MPPALFMAMLVSCYGLACAAIGIHIGWRVGRRGGGM